MTSIDSDKTTTSDRPLSRSILSYSSALLFAQAVGLVQGFIVIRWMEPSAMGLWLSLQLISIYGAHAHLGLVNAVNRQIPFYVGKGDPESARKVERVARANLVMLTAVSLVGLGVCLLVLRPAGATGRGIFALTFATILTVDVNFYLGLFRARHQFGRAGIANVVNSVVMLLGLPLVYYFQLDGLLIRVVTTAAVTLLACVALDGWTFAMEVDWLATKGLVRVGLPILGLSYGIVLFSAMDRTLIAWLFDAEAMGQYALCFAVGRIVRLFPNLIGQVYYPRMTEAYASTGLTLGLLRTCGHASLVGAAAAGVACGGAYVVLPHLVEAFFPKYITGLPALQLALLAFFLLALTTGPRFFLISTVQKRRQFAVLLASTAIMALTASALADKGLVGIAWALVVGTAAYVVGLWAVVVLSVRYAAASVRA